MNYSYKNKNCIVTGGSGFIGQVLVQRLLNLEAKVYVIDNFSYGAKRENIDKRAKIIFGDVRDKKNFKKLPKIKYHFFFHFAAPSSITLFNKNYLECADITINGFLNVASFCINKKIRLVYPSTGSLYSGTKPPQSEKSKIVIDTLNSYAKTKLSLEFMQNSLKGLDSLGLRIFAGYGPQEKHKADFASVIFLFCKDMLKGKSPVIFGDGNQKRDFVYINDVIEAILALAEKYNGSIINIGSGKSVSFNDIVAAINKITSQNIKPHYIIKPKKYLERTQADVRELSKFYKCKYDINQGINEIINSFKR